MPKRNLFLPYIILQIFFFGPPALLAQTIGVAGSVSNDKLDEEELVRKGILLSEEGEYEAAVEAFERATLIEDGQGGVAYHNMGYAYELSGKKKEALEAYQKAVDRNPGQVLSIQKLGKLQYQLGNYYDAIDNGERVLKIDPLNREVRTWLPDAYRKAAEQHLFDLEYQAEQQEQSGENPECNCNSAQSARQYRVDFYTQPAILYRKAQGDFALHKQAGLSYVPMGVAANAMLANEFEVNMRVDSPQFGVLQPNFMASQEEIEFRIHQKHFYYGFGLLFTQINLGDADTPGITFPYTNTDFTYLKDSKVGFQMGSTSHVNRFSISLYPNYPFGDPKSAPQSSAMDFVNFDMNYRTLLNVFSRNIEKSSAPPFFFDFRFAMNEIYLTEYDIDGAGTNVGHYFGTYDLSLGLEIGAPRSKSRKIHASYGLTYTTRLYMLDLSSTDINTFGNGQGFFGFNSASAIEGNAFPGFRSNSHIITVFSRQTFGRHFLMKEGISYEHALTFEPYNAILVDLSFSLLY